MKLALNDRFLRFKSGLTFNRTPHSKKVRLELDTDGRQISFLVSSLASMGYSVFSQHSPIVYRDLMLLSKGTGLGFVAGGKSRDCHICISDNISVLESVRCDKRILLKYDFFNLEQQSFRMPYFMHPEFFRRGLHRKHCRLKPIERRIRVGFYGTRDSDFYTKNFLFPIINREDILATFLREFQHIAWAAKGCPRMWQSKNIAVSIDDHGGDRKGKDFLPLDSYFLALRNTEFVLAPPGWCMPLSHSLIEAMAAGCIPILNSASFLFPPLVDGVNCLTFSSSDTLREAVQRALSLPIIQVQKMRAAVEDYYNKFLDPSAWMKPLLGSNEPALELVVNAEEISVAMLQDSFGTRIGEN